MTSFTLRRQLTVEWGQCDPAGIVFNSRFFEMFDASTWMLFATALGVKTARINDTFGIILPLVDARANFIKPAKFGDDIEIATRVSEFRRSSFDVEHKIDHRRRIGGGRLRNPGLGGARQGRPGEDRRHRYPR